MDTMIGFCFVFVCLCRLSDGIVRSLGEKIRILHRVGVTIGITFVKSHEGQQRLVKEGFIWVRYWL